MRSIRNAWKVLSRLCIVLAFVIALESVVGYCYEDWYSTVYTRLSVAERKELKGTIDTVYCGSSVAYYALNPAYLDEQLGTNSFNLATSGQPLFGSYYLIREAAELNPLRQVYQVVTIPSLKKERPNQKYLAAYNNLSTWRWRLRFLATLQKEEFVLSALVPSAGVDTYMDFTTVKENIAHKKDPYLDVAKYAGRGFRVDTAVYDGSTEDVPNRKLKCWYGEQGASQMDENAVKYLRKAAEFCRKNKIRYTLLVLPQPQACIDLSGDIDSFHECLNGLAEELGADLYDFQLYKERPEIFTDDKFQDIEHLNETGGKLFNEILAKVLKSDHPEDCFYDSIGDFAA